MTVAALVALGVPVETVEQSVRGLGLEGFSIRWTSRNVHAIDALRFIVREEGRQPQRTYATVRKILERGALADEGTRTRALRTFELLARAEARVHGCAVDDVHFHEVGAIDSIVDIVAASSALTYLGCNLNVSPLPLGRGFVRTQHGSMPVPPPAVLHVLEGVPCMSADIDGEMVTPTGAAIVKANASSHEAWPAMRPLSNGFGAGSRTWPDRPNALRAVLAEPYATEASAAGFVVVECNIDDATGELVGTVFDALFAAGALDVWTTPIGMKKSRPAIMLCALTESARADQIARVMFAEGTTIGVRMRACDRIERARRIEHVQTPFGAVPVKIADGDGLPRTVKPEHADVARIAAERGVPAREVWAAALTAAAERLRQ